LRHWGIPWRTILRTKGQNNKLSRQWLSTMDVDREEEIFEALLEYLRQERGFDFTGYKRSSLKRRVLKQMHSHRLENFGEYLDYLQVHPEEFLPLFNTILINVTSFFRDPEAWTFLQQEILPQLIAAKPDKSPLRVWSAGCASGAEAYTLAIILAEVLGEEAFRQRVKIYATDIDEDALNQARHNSYRAQSLEFVPAELRERYFDTVGEQFSFRSDLRRAVIFGRHDLVQDAPISRLDLLVCRNALMYFNAEIQTKILRRFHFALNDAGILFLGKAEMLLSHTALFAPINLPHRIFRRTIRSNDRNLLELLPQTNIPVSNNSQSCLRLKELGFDAVPLAQMIVDFSGRLVLANTPAREMFGLKVMDLGCPLQDLEISFRPLELRSRIEQVYRERRLLVVQDVIREVAGQSRQYLEVQINPLGENNGEFLGVSISFIDVSCAHELQEELQESNQELEITNEKLQSANEELETTNEELQSTNEELESTNEELQSTNQELETINEELQSTNEELQTINDELQERTHDLYQSNAFSNSVLASLQAGVIVMDDKYTILSWNHESENLWGMRSEEVKGQSLWTLDIGLPLEQMREPLRNCLTRAMERQESVISAMNRRGQTIQCRLSYNPLMGHKNDIQGVIIVMEEVIES
jgi:two-component system, chemotaxis family, CheB/CheR fusion protein